MCLDPVFRGKEKLEALSKLPAIFPVYKITERDSKGVYHPPLKFGVEKFFSGRQKAKKIRPTGCGYMSGYHAFTTRADAFRHWIKKRWRPVISCTAHKKDILAIGYDAGVLVVVLSHITFPKKCGKAPEKGK